MKKNKVKSSVFSTLRKNECIIDLDEVESKFIRENLSDMNYVTLKDVAKTLNEFKNRSSIRYFENKDLDVIAKDLYERIISEEVGRSKSTPKQKIDSVNIDPHTGNFIVFHDNKEYVFKDEGSAILFKKNNNIL